MNLPIENESFPVIFIPRGSFYTFRITTSWRTITGNILFLWYYRFTKKVLKNIQKYYFYYHNKFFYIVYNNKYQTHIK